MAKLTDRLKNGWNAFVNNKDPSKEDFLYTNEFSSIGYGSSYRPDRPRLTRGNERSIITALYNRIAMDVAELDFRHVRLDKDGRYLEDIIGPTNDCLTISANIDQTGRDLIHDLVFSMFDEGYIAVAPIDTDDNPNTDTFDIYSLRVCRILEWYPEHVKINAYNERLGKRQDILFRKDAIAIIENPFYSVMNEPNSTVRRLIRKLNILDAIDEQSGAGKLDLIIQLPYVIKGEARQKQAEYRRKNIETQLANSKYGIAYIDGTEHITQLNRPADNNLMNQVKYLTDLAYSQIGITDTIMNGTADSNTMNNYYSRVIELIAQKIVDEFNRKFISKTARTQGQTIMFFNNPFRLIPVDKIAEMSDSLTRNEILTSNEVRGIIGLKPSKDPNADKLRNKNLNQSPEAMSKERQIGEEDEQIN